MDTQMLLPYFAWRGSLRESCDYYLAHGTEGLAKSTVEAHIRRCEMWCAYFGNGMRVADITYELLQRYVAKFGPKGKGWLNHTMKNHLETLSVVLQEAVRRGLIDKLPPWPKLRLERPRKARIVERDDLDKVRKLLPEQWSLWLLMAFYTGMRRDCIHTTLWAHIDLERGMFLRRSSKTHAFADWFPIHDELLAVLRLRHEMHRPRKGDPVVGKWVVLSRTLRRACIEAGVDHFTPTSLRASCRSHMLAAGFNNAYVNLVLCHSEKVGQGHYTGPTKDMIENARAALKKIR